MVNLKLCLLRESKKSKSQYHSVESEKWMHIMVVIACQPCLIMMVKLPVHHLFQKCMCCQDWGKPVSNSQLATQQSLRSSHIGTWESKPHLGNPIDGCSLGRMLRLVATAKGCLLGLLCHGLWLGWLLDLKGAKGRLEVTFCPVCKPTVLYNHYNSVWNNV